MRKNLLTGALIAFTLCSCNSSGQGPNPTTTVEPASVSKYAEQICKFLPTVDTITGIIASGVPGLSTAEAIAKAICDALPKGGATLNGGAAALPGPAPTVAGIPIHGRYIK